MKKTTSLARTLMMLLAVLTSASAWALTPKEGDTWNESTKTLTVNSNPVASAYSGETEIEHLIIGSGVTTIGSDAFWDCSNLKSVTIGSDVTTIESSAFLNCVKLTSVSIPKNVAVIAPGAFGYCTGLTSFTVDGANDNFKSIGGVIFSKDETQLVLYPCGKSSSTYTIPNSVITIGESAFFDSFNLSTINIPNSVITIGDGAFMDCNSLKSVTIPNSVTSIGKYAFNGSNLSSVTIPNSVTSIGDGAFYDLWMTSVSIGSGVATIGSEAFASCKKLETITVDAASENFKSEDNVLFSKDGTQLIAYAAGKTATSYEIPASVTSIGANAFESCPNLTSINIPDNVTSIGESAFNHCYNLATITGCNKVTSVGYNAFYDTPWYNGQPNGLMYVGHVAYKYKGTMPNNTSITLADGTTQICDACFFNQTQLTSITIPNSVTYIGANAFYSCTNLNYVNCYADPANLTWIDGGFDDFKSYKGTLCFVNNPEAFDAKWATGNKDTDVRITFMSKGGSCGTNLTYEFDFSTQTLTISGEGDMFDYESQTSVPWYNYHNNITSLNIGSDVTSIGENAFFFLDKLGTVAIPDKVTAIGKSAFCSCTSLASVTFGSGSQLNTIGSNAFQYCSNLTGIVLPVGVTSIGGAAFYNCIELASIAIPDGVETLSSTIFAGCKKLETVTFGAKSELKTVDTFSFQDCIKLASIELPVGVTSIGGAAFKGCTTLASVTIPAGVTSIGSSAFHNCTELASVTIPAGVASIDRQAFSGCTKLESVAIPAGVASIGLQAFSGCTKLESVAISADVETIGNYAFENCSKLQTVTFEAESKLTTIGLCAFYNCPLLENITLPAKLSTLGEGAFRVCKKLKTLTIPEGVEVIANNTFARCEGLTSIKLPSTLTTIGLTVFSGCSNLSSIIIPAKVTSIGNNAFLNCTSMTDVYCLADPANLNWDERGCNDFKTDGSTKCHVANKAAFEAKWKTGSTGSEGTDVNAEFVEDVTVFEDAADNTAAIDALDDQTKTVYISGRTLKAGHWNSLCLPFNLTSEQIKETFGEEAVVKTLDSYSNDGTNVTIGFATVTAMEAGAPYIVFIPKGSDIINPVFRNVKINNQWFAVSKGDAFFYGLYNPLNASPSTSMLFLKDDTFYYPTADITVNAFRCLIDLAKPVPEVASAKIIVDFGDEETTGIGAALNENGEMTNDVWYTLQGVKLDGKPSEKGIYIYNGRKVAIQ